MAVGDAHQRLSHGELQRRVQLVSARLQRRHECAAAAAAAAASRVLLAVRSSVDAVVARWALWHAGLTHVPVDPSHPLHHIDYVLRDSNSSLVVSDEAPVLQLAQQRGVQALALSELVADEREFQATDSHAAFTADSATAMIIYTSGTTGNPKGVMWSFAALRTQIASLSQAWNVSHRDHILHALPLHHIHGVINALECTLWNGGSVTLLPKFNAAQVWASFCNDPSINLFMAVPTMYSRLISAFDKMDSEDQERCSLACKNFRLMVSGSAALPESILRRWKDISGHVLLERYGMTEIGMALTNPLDGERRPQFVGKPFPFVDVKIEPDRGYSRAPNIVQVGELRVKSPFVFSGYYGAPQATQAQFDEQGWFKTGDIAALDDRGDYKILGRSSVDVIKTSGFKVSALEIEQCLLEHSSVQECAVVGVPNEELGEVISLAVVFREGEHASLGELQRWVLKKLPRYKVPRRCIRVDQLPRNAMGKINKKKVLAHFIDQPA